MFAAAVCHDKAASQGRSATGGAPRRPIASAAGNQAVLRLARRGLQPKLMVGPVDDPFEREADEIAGQVLAKPDAPFAARHTIGNGCAECGAPEKARRTAARLDGAGEAPSSVDAALAGPGRPLDAATRAFFEPRFGRDFSAVRVHTDTVAARSASEIGSLAYTIGPDIVFGAGQFAPGSAQGNRLLAHELTHVVQQGAAADGVVRRKLSCPELINPADTRVTRGIGTPAHDAIEDYFRGKVGKAFWRERIPDASAQHLRSEDPDPRKRRSPTGEEVVKPQTIGGRAGPGEPDLGYRRKEGIVELAEVKPATLTYGTVGGLVEGGFQLANYLEKGMSDDNKGWRGRRRIKEFVPMPDERIAWPAQLDVAGGRKVMVGWCLPGIVGYRPMTEDDLETIACGTSDKGAIDRFLNVGLDKAEGVVDLLIDKGLDPEMTKKIAGLTVRDGVRYVAKHSARFMQDFLARQHSLKTEILISIVGESTIEMGAALLAEDELVDMAADWIQDEVGAEGDAILRQIATELKKRLFTSVRRRIKEGLRTYLQQSLNALCAAATVGALVSIAQLLKKFGEDLGKMLADAIAATVKGWVAEAEKALAKSIVFSLLIVVAAAALILLLPAVLAALEGVTALVLAGVASLAAAAAAIGSQLQPMLDQLAGATP